MPKSIIRAALAAAWFASVAQAQSDQVTIGTDTFMSGQSVQSTLAGPGDVFVSGATVVLKGRAGGDTHVAGFDLAVESPVDGDLYAAGATFTLHAPVAEDLTAAGFSLRIAEVAVVQGNARLAGATVIIDGPVLGALTASGGEVTLNAQVSGDALLAGETLVFGPEARIGGRLSYAAPEPLDIPESVIAADRVSYRKLEIPDYVMEARRDWERGAMPSGSLLRAAALSFFITLAFFIVLSAILLAFAPDTSERLRRTVEDRPGVAFLSGFVGLAVLFGLVPVAVLTILGIPLVPVVVLVILLAWMLGYLLGVYVVVMRMAAAFGMGDQPGMAIRLLAIAIGIAVSAALNFIPILGWVANFTLVILGIGGMFLAAVGPRLAAPAAASETA